jgi:hypothetical protein
MQWFKHQKDFRRTASIQYIESQLGEVGYARALKLIEIFCVACPRKPFVPRIEIKPPFDWHWLSLEMGCPETEVLRTIEVLATARFIEIPEKVIIQPRARGKEQITRPGVITCNAMLEWVEWHDLSNRNKKRIQKEDAVPRADGKFPSAVGTPGDDAGPQAPRVTHFRNPPPDLA